jgi:GntR family transcriptional regulator
VFRIDGGSAVPLYRQIVQQVRRDLMLGRLQPGQQLPSVHEVVGALAINPNTVVKAYGELEHAGIVVRRQGVGTFISSSPAVPALAVPAPVLSSLLRWVGKATEAGLSAEQIRVLIAAVLDDTADGGGALSTGRIA